METCSAKFLKFESCGNVRSILSIRRYKESFPIITRKSYEYFIEYFPLFG